MFITLTCPKCGANIQYDDSREIGFCSFCGAKIIPEKKIIENRIKNDYSQEVAGYIRLGNMRLQQGNKNEAREFFEKALLLDANNNEALNGIAELERIITAPNLTITRLKTFSGSGSPIKVYINGEEMHPHNQKHFDGIAHGETIKYMLPCGTHSIYFSFYGAKSETLTVRIDDMYSQAKIEVKLGTDKWKNAVFANLV